MKYLIVTDYQHVFVDGKLGTLQALKIYQAVKDKIFQRIHEGWQVVLTYDTHDENYLNTMEGRNLPIVHGIEGTPEWELYGNLLEEIKFHILYHRVIEELPLPDHVAASKAVVKYLTDENNEDDSGPLIVKKHNFGYNEWQYLIPDAEEIEVIGVCTDICVISNVLILKAQFPEVPIRVDADCCAGTTESGHWAALRTMLACQVIVYCGENPWKPQE